VFDEVNRDQCFVKLDITADIEAFIDQLVQFDAVISSSLHGAVAAHAYGIPARLISVSSRPLGDGFKYIDYLSTIGLEVQQVKACDSPASIKRAADDAQLPRAVPNLKALLDTCPFIYPAVATALHTKILAEYRLSGTSRR
ncbi:unnamed protein product, partial [marine sediment metagenome]